MTTTNEEFRDCGDCGLCCKLPPIEHTTDLDKPAGKWCRHWAPKEGCRIYADRERVCRSFNCLWRVGYVPENLKPTKTKCVLVSYEAGVLIVYVDQAYPQAWLTGNMRKYLSGWGDNFVVRIGDEKRWVYVNKGLPIEKWRTSLMPDKNENT